MTEIVLFVFLLSLIVYVSYQLGKASAVVDAVTRNIIVYQTIQWLMDNRFLSHRVDENGNTVISELEDPEDVAEEADSTEKET